MMTMEKRDNQYWNTIYELDFYIQMARVSVSAAWLFWDQNRLPKNTEISAKIVVELYRIQCFGKTRREIFSVIGRTEQFFAT